MSTENYYCKLIKSRLQLSNPKTTNDDPNSNSACDDSSACSSYNNTKNKEQQHIDNDISKNKTQSDLKSWHIFLLKSYFTKIAG